MGPSLNDVAETKIFSLPALSNIFVSSNSWTVMFVAELPPIFITVTFRSKLVPLDIFGDSTIATTISGGTGMISNSSVTVNVTFSSSSLRHSTFTGIS